MPIPKNGVDGFLQKREAEREAIEADLNWMPGDPPEEDDRGPMGRRIKTLPKPPTRVMAETISLVEAREMLMEQMYRLIKDPSPTSVLLAKAAPGTGKTFAAVRVAEQAAMSGRKVLYAGPRHEFFLDILRLSERPELWYEWLPRQLADEEKGKPETCKHAPYINKWLSHGYPAKEFCRQICGWDYFSLRCPYQAQRNRKEPVIFGQHQHVFLGHPVKFGLVIGDESPLTAVCHEWKIPARHILPDGMPDEQPLAEILYKMQSIAEQEMRIEGEPLLAAIGGADRVKQAVETLLISPEAIAFAPTLSIAEDVDNLPYFHLGHLVHLLLRESTAALAGREYPHRIVIDKKKLLMLCRHTVNDALPPHVIWLDATAHPRIYEAIFQRPVDVVEPRVKPQGRIIQVHERANGVSFLFDQEENKPTPKLDQLVQQVDAIAQKYQAVGVITHLGVEERFSHYPDRGHYFAARGTNRFDHVDALIIAGVPQPPTFEVDKIARMLFFDRMEPFYQGGVLPRVTKPRPYQYVAPDGKGRAYPTSVFDDEDLQAVLWQFREAELIQAAHRGRPNIRPVDIWLLENIPVDELPPDILIDMREVFDAPKKVNIWVWPKVLAMVQQFESEGRTLTPPDLVEQLGVSSATASKYIEDDLQPILVKRGWTFTKGLRPPHKIGRPRMGLIPPGEGDFFQ